LKKRVMGCLTQGKKNASHRDADNNIKTVSRWMAPQIVRYRKKGALRSQIISRNLKMESDAGVN